MIEPAGRWLTTHFGLDGLVRWEFSWPPAGLGQGALIAEACLGLLLIAATAAVALRGTGRSRNAVG